VQHIQMPFNLLDWRWREAGVVDALAVRPDVTVHVRSVFLQGLLAAGDPSVWPVTAGVDPAALLQNLDRLVRELGRDSAADLCMAYVQGQTFLAGVVIGLETEAQLDENLRLFAKPALTPAECRLVEDRLPRCPEQLLNPALWPKK
jgi:aryl-alcohol dehydrogenase-like predicted oxidoreductase